MAEVLNTPKSGIKIIGLAKFVNGARKVAGIGEVKVAISKRPGGVAVAATDVSKAVQVGVTTHAGMRGHTQLLTTIGELLYGAVNTDPGSPQASYAVQAIRNPAKAIGKG